MTTKLNQKMIYQEDDWEAEVLVLADKSDAECKRYTLKVVKTIRASHRYTPTPDGEIFSVKQQNNVFWAGMWHLSSC